MKTIVVALIVVVLMGAAGYMGFNIGTSAGKTQVENTSVTGTRGGGGFQPGQGGAGFQPGQGGAGFQPGQSGTPSAGGGARAGVNGTIKSVNGNTVQLTEQNGTVITVTLDARTVIQKTTTAAPGEIQAGTRITVTGDTANGAVTARTIQLGAGGQ